VAGATCAGANLGGMLLTLLRQRSRRDSA
jgi:hypothetical protein